MCSIKKLKQICLFAFLGVILLCLISCGSKPVVSQKNNPITLKMLTVGASSEEACQRISRELSNITEEKYGFSVEIDQIPLVDYHNHLSGCFLTGKQPDLFCFTSTENLLRYIHEGYVCVLDSYLPNSSPIRFHNNNELWQYVSIDNKIYAIPSNNSLNYYLGFCARSDIVEELGVNPANITTWEALHDLLIRVKRKYPQITPVVPDAGTIIPSLGQDPLGDNLGVLLDNQGTIVENLFASEAYAQTCERMYHWQQEGLILKNAFNCEYSSGYSMRFYNGFGFFASINTERLSSLICAYGDDLTVFSLSPNIANSSSVSSGWCLSASSPYKQESIELLELLYTNRDACDLCFYGQEHIDYLRLDSSNVTKPETPPDDVWEYNPWEWPNCQIASNWVLEIGNTICVPDYGSQRSPAMGFVFDTSSVQNLCNRCQEIISKYDKALLSGYLDPETALPQFLQELENAGINQIIAQKQSQLNFWFSNKS